MSAKYHVPLFLIAAAFTASAHADSTKATNKLYGCLEIAEDAARLACFDAEVLALKTAETAGEVKTIQRSEVEEIERDAFGLSLPSLPKIFRQTDNDGKSEKADDEGIQELTVAIKQIKTTQSGKMVIYLENGHVWQQLDSERIPNYKLKKAQEARVKRALFGSFLMSIDGSSSFRVRRIQ